MAACVGVRGEGGVDVRVGEELGGGRPVQGAVFGSRREAEVRPSTYVRGVTMRYQRIEVDRMVKRGSVWTSLVLLDARWDRTRQQSCRSQYIGSACMACMREPMSS
jgi:hypothetical protein